MITVLLSLNNLSQYELYNKPYKNQKIIII